MRDSETEMFVGALPTGVCIISGRYLTISRRYKDADVLILGYEYPLLGAVKDVRSVRIILPMSQPYDHCIVLRRYQHC